MLKDTRLKDAPHIAPTHGPQTNEPAPQRSAPRRLWMPKRVLITRSAGETAMADEVEGRAKEFGAEIVRLTSDRVTGLKGETPAESYRLAKSTLVLAVAPPSKMKPQPIPPSADWRFDLAEGCPAHCQYCYLAGSLKGAPVTRVWANREAILDGLESYVGHGTVTSRSKARAGEGTTFEASCYTDPLGIEHLTGSLSAAVRHFGAWEADVQLRFTTKFADVEPLLGIAHNGRTRARFSVNAEEITRRFEGGTARLDARLEAMGELARAGYPVGLTVAPIMPLDGWREAYDDLLARAADALPDGADVTAELITHRFTPGSRDVLLGWYPGTKLEMDPAVRDEKRTKFGTVKFVYPKALMAEMKEGIEASLADRLPQATALYWT